jgi:hypothetical protein
MRAAIAAFASSEEGEFYGLVCEHYRMDPGGVFDDDVEAFMMRQALMTRSRPVAEAEATDIYQEWAKGATSRREDV